MCIRASWPIPTAAASRKVPTPSDTFLKFMTVFLIGFMRSEGFVANSLIPHYSCVAPSSKNTKGHPILAKDEFQSTVGPTNGRRNCVSTQVRVSLVLVLGLRWPDLGNCQTVLLRSALATAS